MLVHEQAHALSTDISTTCVLNGVNVFVLKRNVFLNKIHKK